MFRAIGRYLRALGYFVTGRFDRARQSLSMDPDVVRATYDRVIEEKKARIHQYKDAVGAMIVQEERKKSALKRLSEEVARLRKLREGAAAMARKVVERHQGDVASVKADQEYTKCQSAYKDFSSSLEEKENHCNELDVEIRELAKSISGHKTQLESLLRDLEKIRQEKHATVAEIITAQEEREIADMIAGISKDRTTEELQELRDLRDRAKATARVSREMAGTDIQRSEAEFLEYAAKSAADDEFDALIGLSKETPRVSAEPIDKTRIPDA
jgi:phage shock protein A